LPDSSADILAGCAGRFADSIDPTSHSQTISAFDTCAGERPSEVPALSAEQVVIAVDYGRQVPEEPVPVASPEPAVVVAAEPPPAAPPSAGAAGDPELLGSLQPLGDPEPLGSLQPAGDAGPLGEAGPLGDLALSGDPALLGDAALLGDPELLGAEGDTGGFTVRLKNFTGPFDLLLQLIGKHKLDVTEVALHQVTDDFIAYIRAMGDEWDLGEASEFLLVAATLLDLKAARLLPSAEVEDEEDLALLEARDLLFARLLQYKAYKEAAAFIADLEGTGARRWPRAVSMEPRYAEALPDLVLGIGAERLFKLALKQFLPKPGPPEVSIAHIHQVRVSVREHAALLRERLRRAGSATFSLLIADCDNTLEVVARFLALLELYREGLIEFEQPVSLDELTVRWVGGDDAGGELDIDDYEGSPPDPDAPPAESVTEADLTDGLLSGPESAPPDLEPDLSGSERAVSEFEPARSGSERALPEFEPELSGSERVLPEFEPRSSGAERAESEFEPARSGSERAVPEFEPELSGFDGVSDFGPELSGPEPAVSGPESTMSGPEPAVSVPEPTVSGPEPAVSGFELGVSGTEPAFSGSEPAATGFEPELSGPGSAENENDAVSAEAAVLEEQP
jgi:segregation and condensation protein A